MANLVHSACYERADLQIWRLTSCASCTSSQHIPFSILHVNAKPRSFSVIEVHIELLTTLSLRFTSILVFITAIRVLTKC